MTQLLSAADAITLVSAMEGRYDPAGIVARLKDIADGRAHVVPAQELVEWQVRSMGVGPWMNAADKEDAERIRGANEPGTVELRPLYAAPPADHRQHAREILGALTQWLVSKEALNWLDEIAK